MPNTTPLVKITYPSENEDPFFPSFVSMMSALDTALYALREDRGLILMGGGLFTFTSSSGVLTWASEIDIFSPLTGFKIYIAAGQVTLNDGQCFYIATTRNPSGNTAATMVVGSTVPATDDNQLLIGIRKGTTVYFRNGRTINDGDNASVLSDTAAQYWDFGPGPAVIQAFTGVGTLNQRTDIATVIPSAPFTITLPTPLVGKEYIVKSISNTIAGNNVTLQVANLATQTIDGATTYVFATNWGAIRIRTISSTAFYVIT